ncbi:hypothetical protein ABW286_09215 [Erwinia papayae]|uniref:Uncharacterized protein n=1 Tax=Erwinia papayae TaxID=206499 RepID=A0ABV3N0L9_9GAMM
MSVGGNSDKLSREYISQHITVGKTTKSDVRRDFGTPASGRISIKSDGSESWYYPVDSGYDLLGAAASLIPISGASTAANVASSNNTKDTNSLMIWFDKNGIVTNWIR